MRRRASYSCRMFLAWTACALPLCMPTPASAECVIEPATSCPGVDLSSRDLEGADLTGAHLEKAKLSRANLKKAKLRDAHMAHARLGRAILRERIFPAPI